MKSLCIALAIVLLPVICLAADIPVLPGAEGHGVYTSAGRGGRVIVVSNTNDSGVGSFRAAVADSSGPRTVVFETSGYIQLDSRVTIDNPYLTIAGHTAPEPGITIRTYDIIVSTHDVLIQHVRLRIGDEQGFPAYPDGILIGSSSEPDSVYNVVLDHCSISWAIDESMSLLRGAHDVTISNCVISEPLDHSIHPKGNHPMGPLVLPTATRTTFFRNIIAHSGGRNPKYTGGCTGVFANNIVYNCQNSPDIQPTDSTVTDPVLLTFEGNHFKPREAQGNLTWHALIVQAQEGATYWRTGSKVYIDDNICTNCDGTWDNDVFILGEGNSVTDSLDASTRQTWPDSGLTLWDADQLIDSLVTVVGAFPRDTVDERIVDDVVDSTGTMIDCVGSTQLDIDDGDIHTAANSPSPHAILKGAIATTDYAYEGYTIEVSDGSTSQIRTVVDHDFDYMENPDSLDSDTHWNWVEVDSAWTTVPDSTYSWEIYETCDRNAGGWPVLASNNRTLSPPDNPQDDDDGDGYTNLEEWIHTFPREEPVISDFEAYTDSSVIGGATYFEYQYQLRAKWHTDMASTSQLEYRELGDTTWMSTTQDPTLVTDHFVKVTDLSAGTSYEVRPISEVLGTSVTGGVDTATTEDADLTVSSLNITQQHVTNPPGITLTFSFNTDDTSSCKINVRAEDDPPASWGTDEFTQSSLHGTSHSHDVSGLVHNKWYNAYIRVYPNASFNGEDTMHPDGAVPQTATIVYIRVKTMNKRGQGGEWEFVYATTMYNAPSRNYLAQNYPNPFNPSTTIEYGVRDPNSYVHLAVYNVRGQLVATIADGRHNPGIHREVWLGHDSRGQRVAGGVYFVRLSVGGQTFVRKMVLIK